jgi:RNA polymerase sigma factor (sigma-70 family)
VNGRGGAKNNQGGLSVVIQTPEWSDAGVGKLALRVRYFLRKKFPDLDQATLDDLVQEVMQAAYMAWQQQRFEARQGAQFETFVLQIARHKASDYLRQRRRRRDAIAPAELLDSRPFDLEMEVTKTDLLERVKKAVELLEERHAQVLRLHFYEDMKIKEIARQLGVSEQEVSNLKSYALRKLKEILLGK